MSGALPDRLRRLARELGFVRIGFARAEALEREARWLRAYVEQGRHGTMRWLAETAEVRIDPRHPGMLPSARSVVVVVLPCPPANGSARHGPGRIARYALGRDYHNVLGKRLRRLVAALRDAGHEARGGTDRLPILERAWAARAGVGFLGKNACLIVPGLGSHVLLGVVVTSAELPPDEPMPSRCGSCTACLDACPTGALIASGTIDARRCVSYLTIEHRGSIDPALRPGVGDWLFGCDACQDVCPFNRARGADGADNTAFAGGPDLGLIDAEGLLRASDARIATWTRGSPLARAGPESLARNAAIVLGNAGGRRHLPVLRAAAAGHASPVVREAAAWAAERLANRGE
ncbi:MAG: tRNA epoxyqueuosine(34) reductase QueG [Myxococcota bacterium]|nr:tRNA epoxyqueuosine(34) reductase QueG [Myxococcota bacterium]